MDLQISYLAANDTVDTTPTPTPTPPTDTLPTPTNSTTDTSDSEANSNNEICRGGELSIYSITLWIIVFALTIISTAIAL